MSGSLVSVRGLTKTFMGRGGRRTVAVDDVSFDIGKGETFGLAGESGGGKSTLGRMILGLIQPSVGEISFDGTIVSGLSATRFRPLRRRMQMVFQNPLGSLNPRKPVGASIALPLINFTDLDATGRRDRVARVLELVGLSFRDANRYPHEFSGGQAQRICIARALAIEPDFVFLDEPVSALDVSIQAQILNLLRDLQERLGLTYLFVAHNLSVVHFMCDRCAVMRGGSVVEMGAAAELFRSPREPYTRKLLSAMLEAGPQAS